MKKTEEYCLIIPVINEGERIHALLERIVELGLHKIVDIIIVDGGTTDGSLDECYLKSQHVHTLLLKTLKENSVHSCSVPMILQRNWDIKE